MKIKKICKECNSNYCYAKGLCVLCYEKKRTQKPQRKEYLKQYYIRNRDRIKLYRIENKESIKLYQQKYYLRKKCG